MKTAFPRLLTTLSASLWVLLGMAQTGFAQVNLPGTGTNLTEPPVISISASDPAAWEKSTEAGVTNFAQFTIRREGNTNATTWVSIQLQGSAIPGGDYLAIPSVITMPPGAREIHTVVQPLDDGTEEGDETVTMVLLPDFYMAPMARYELGASTNATIIIKDNEPKSNIAPVVLLTTPANHSIFSNSAPVVVTGLAEARASRIQMVEFFMDDHWVGGITNITQPGVFSFTYPLQNTAAGTHVLTATAWTANSASTSAPVHITVTSSPVDAHLVTGYLKREVYLDVPGIMVADLTNSAKFPDKPNQMNFIKSFEAPMDVADNYGQRISGYLKPPTDGQYVFYIASDDQGELWLSSDSSPERKVRIATQDTWGMPREWSQLPGADGSINNRSEPITLMAGHYYYMEALMKEGGGGDHCAVAWQKPGELPPVNGDLPIAGEYLATSPVYLTNQIPIVNISASTNGIVEGMTNFYFRISRTLQTNSNLLVAWSLGGTASNGVDYVRLPLTNTIPAGSRYVDVRVQTIDDKLVEADETIVAELIPTVLDRQLVYGIGSSNRATVVIRDNDSLTNQLATLVITSPTNGATFMAPVIVPINATATDPHGTIYRVEFYANDKLVGVSQIFTLVAPPAGTPMYHSVVWTNTVPGIYTLTAKATDALGHPVVSGGIHVTVQGTVAERELHGIGVYSGNFNGGPSPNNLRGEALVKVNRPGKRVTLFLSAYEPVHWQVNVSNGSIVEKVILGGFYPQTISGLGAGVEIVEAFPGGNYGQVLWSGYEVGSVRFNQTLPKLYALTGMQLSSFQGLYTALMPGGFTIDKVQDDPRLLYKLPFSLTFWSGSPGTTNGHLIVKHYTLDGPVDTNAFLPGGMRATRASDGRFYYGAEAQSVYMLDSRIGTTVKVNLGSGVPELSWPMGMTYDSMRRRVLLVSLGGEGFLYAKDSTLSRWSLVSSMKYLDFDCLQYHASDDSLYGLEVYHQGSGHARLLRLNANGVYTGAIELPELPFDVSPTGYRSELTSVGDYLALLLSPASVSTSQPRESRIYLIDPKTSQVWLTYQHNEPLPNRWPEIGMLSPQEGGDYPVNAPMLLKASATDPDGYVKSVEFFVNDRSVGQGVSLSSAQGVYALQWTPKTPGNYTASAKATDNRNATSPSVHVSFSVSQPIVVSTAVRTLPEVYLPQTAFRVEILVSPKPGAYAYALEDAAPWGWTVSSISHEGVFDRQSGKVKFGPFFDSEPRTMSYRVTPPDDAVAEGAFLGQLSVDGVAQAITGDDRVPSARQYHPADHSPEDHLMSMNEVTAYSAAWKKGEGWYVGPKPIPMDYVTRAGALWKGGESYVFSPAAGAPPYCWVNVRRMTQLTTIGAMVVVAESRIASELPATYTPGAALTVTLTATPRAGVLAYAVEDQPPTGWTVSSISPGGAWDAINGRVKWIFTDGQPRSLTYQVTPPTTATAAGLFAGSAVFDDMSAPQTSRIQSRRQTLPGDASAPQLGQCSQQPDGSWILPVISVPGARVVIEVSINAVQWDPLAVIVNQSGLDKYTDRSATNAFLKFYRARLEE